MLALLKKIFKPSNHEKELVCVQISKKGLSLVLAKIKPILQILNCQYFNGDLKVQQDSLRTFIEHNQLQHMDCYGVLSLDDYQLMLLEKPKVADNEIGESVRWLVKDLIDFPIEEAVIDFFPAPTRVGQPAKIYVVIARLPWLTTIAALIAEVGLNLKRMDIAALAICNVLGALHIVGNSAVLLVKEGEHYYILVVKDQLIYLERKLEFSSQGELNPQMFELFCSELVAELQRSIDFYQNREKTIPVKIFLDPTLGQDQKLIQCIETALNLRIAVLDIHQWLSRTEEIPLDGKANCLSVIGEALGLERLV